jgi:hypothetical protein
MIEAVANIIEHPIFLTIQDTLYRIELAIQNRKALIGVTSEQDNPERIFEMIRTIYNLYKHANAADRLLDLYLKWSIQSSHEIRESTIVHTFVNKEGDFLLRVERYLDGAMALSWPTLKDFRSLISHISQTFQSTNMQSIIVTAWTGTDLLSIEQSIPIDVDGMAKRLSLGRIEWMRFESDQLALFADIATSYRGTPEIGVITRSVDPSWFVELYASTSRRFLFRSWVRRLLEMALSEDGVTQSGS